MFCVINSEYDLITIITLNHAFILHKFQFRFKFKVQVQFPSRALSDGNESDG